MHAGNKAAAACYCRKTKTVVHTPLCRCGRRRTTHRCSVQPVGADKRWNGADGTAATHTHHTNDGMYVTLPECAFYGYATAVCVLIDDAKRDVNERTTASHLLYRTCLHFACMAGQIKVVKELLKRGADVHATNKNGCTPLHEACTHRFPRFTECARLLLCAGADVHAQCQINGENVTPLHEAAVWGASEMMQLLISHGAHFDTGGRSPLHVAASNGRIDCVRVLLGHKADVHARDQQGRTPLFVAASRAQHECVRVLVNGGADINTPDQSNTLHPTQCVC
eukprot:GDKI01002160.1.p1 GENE.GDKI01002160.1~~GDKI01002160.1.p1  ORF type:complete len:281 (+),score=45.29 GDKI01002160.1:218-1060(+)